MANHLTYNGYIGTVVYSAEDEVFHGKIYGINDLVTFEGDSAKTLKKAFEESVDDYLETCKELGKEPNKTFKGSFNVRITTDLHQKVSLNASKKGISLNEYVKKSLSYTIENDNLIISVR